jgi:hypothetical protein
MSGISIQNTFLYTGVFTNELPIDDDQWRYSPDRALASLAGFMIDL